MEKQYILNSRMNYQVQSTNMLEQMQKKNGVPYHRCCHELMLYFVPATMLLTVYQYGKQKDNQMYIHLLKGYFSPCYEVGISNELEYEFSKVEKTLHDNTSEQTLSNDDLYFLETINDMWQGYKEKVRKNPINARDFARVVEDLVNLLSDANCCFWK